MKLLKQNFSQFGWSAQLTQAVITAPDTHESLCQDIVAKMDATSLKEMQTHLLTFAQKFNASAPQGAAPVIEFSARETELLKTIAQQNKRNDCIRDARQILIKDQFITAISPVAYEIAANNAATTDFMGVPEQIESIAGFVAVAFIPKLYNKAVELGLSKQGFSR